MAGSRLRVGGRCDERRRADTGGTMGESPLAEWRVEIMNAPPTFRNALRDALNEANGGAFQFTGTVFLADPDVPSGTIRFLGTGIPQVDPCVP